jgi:hypothetical protein
MEEFDTDIDNYEVDELLKIMGINNPADPRDRNNDLMKRPTEHEIVEFTNSKIAQYETLNPEIADFFKNMQTKLLDNIKEKPDPVPTVKTFTSEVKKGSLNPDVTNTVVRTVNIDSFYRAKLDPNNANTDKFIFTINETLTNTLSMSLYSVEIPYSWYAFTAAKGNTGFVVSTLDLSFNVTSEAVAIPEGNYTNFSLMQTVQTLLNAFLSQVMNTTGDWWTITQDPVHGRVSLTPYMVNGTYFPFDIKLRWFDVSYDTEVLVNSTINNHLGWLLGFRNEKTILFSGNTLQTVTLTVAPKTVTAPSIINTAGTKYIIMKLNDYKTNRLNSGLVCINNNLNNQIALPNYLDTDTKRSRFTYNQSQLIVSPNAPRRLTVSQLHTINSISFTNSENTTTFRNPPFDDSDVFAKIPLEALPRWSTVVNGTNTVVDDAPASLHVNFSGPLQKNVRDFFGPVNITNMQVSLHDDKGFLLGLNGMDWSFALTVKGLYSY